MATIRLIPSTYYLSNSSYLSVTNPDNMYTNTDSTTYGRVYNSRSSTTSYYIYLRGFNFDDIPDDVIINSFSVKLKAYESGVNTTTSYVPYLCNGTTTLSGCKSSAITATTQTLTFSCNLDLDTLIGYGDNFGIRINCRRASRNTAAYMYIYGAEIEINYTLPIYHTITATTDSGTISPSGQTTLLEGEDYTLTISGITPIVTDNNVDVTSQLVQTSEVTATLIPESYENDGFTVSNIDNAYADADSTDYATLTAAAGGVKRDIFFDLEDLSIPSGATIQSVTCQATLQFSRNGSSSGVTASCQMYAGSTAKGSATTIVSSATDVAKTTYTLLIGSWTASEINNARFYVTCTNNASGTARYIYLYGVSFNVTYESAGVIYIYTLTNVTADHVIVVTAQASANKLYVKQNGSWIEVAVAYKKVNGVWVQQTDITTVFQNGVNYRKGS